MWCNFIQFLVNMHIGQTISDGEGALKTDALYCIDLPTHPKPSAGPVLVTGGTGYIGGRLVHELMARGYTVRVMVRKASPEHAERWPGAELVVADASDAASLFIALKGIHTAYYLIHSLLLGPKEFEATDQANARNFRLAASGNGVSHIIYLGGLGDVRTLLSPHLRSRTQVAAELGSGTVPTTVLRAAVIIGSGSASFEIIHHLVRRLRVIAIPWWGRTKCQPIGIRDVIKYLVGVLEHPAAAGQSYDIGGPDVLTYEEMLRVIAEVLGKRLFFIPIHVSNVKLYAYICSLLTPVPAPITRSLMEGLRNDVVCLDSKIRTLIPFHPVAYREAVREAMAHEAQDSVHTRWSDSYPPHHEYSVKLHELPHAPRYTASASVLSARSSSELFKSVCMIGGKQGWSHGNWMWRLRGMLDKLIMGVGTTRGRRSSFTLRVNDVVDFWRVESLHKNRMLLLRAEMKLPGLAWLKFSIDPEKGGQRLSVVAYYDTARWYGKLYWYVFLPFHGYLFDRLVRNISERVLDATIRA
ncbi:MAG: SDR family oxidoreductase [bacterium]